MSDAIPDVLAEVGPRLRRLRERRGLTLTALAAQTGISKSTLSRLETGERKPSLELLLPLAEAHHLPLDELVGAPRVGDPRVRLAPRTRNGRLVYPLTQNSSRMAVWKVVIPPERERRLRTHAGYEWLYVLAGEMRLILGEHDITMADADTLTIAGQTLVAFHDWTFLLGPGFCAGIGSGLLLGYLMYTSGLLPRRVASLGLVGGSFAFLAATGALFDVYERQSTPQFLLTF